MRQTVWCALTVVVIGGFCSTSAAQGPPPGGRMNPVARALDSNGDGEISADELAKAAAALKTLDHNSDGKLSEDELRPSPPGGPGGPGGGFGPGGPGGPGGPALSADETIARYLTLDANKDDQLSKAEVPERMHGLFTRADSDHNGVVSKSELAAMIEQRAANAGPARGVRP